MSASLINVAKELTKLSGFPVIVRPLEEDSGVKSTLNVFRHHQHCCRNHEHGFMGSYTSTHNTDKAGGNAMRGGTKQGTSSAQSGSRGSHGPAHSPKKKGKRKENDGDSDDDKEIMHKIDVEIRLSNSKPGSSQFLRILTDVVVCEYLIYIIKVC